MTLAASHTPSLRALLALAWPMVLARATQAVITACDAWLIAPLGSDELAATTTGGINTFGFVILPMGTVFIVQSFAAQLRGRNDLPATRRFAVYGLVFAALSALVGAAATPLVGPALALAYTGRLHALMTQYMTIRLVSLAAVIGTEALGAWFAGLGNSRMQLIAGTVAMVTNVPLAWVLIHGKFGAPAMGVAGAALASVIASWLGFVVIAAAFVRGWGTPAGAGPRRGSLGLNAREFVRMVRFGLPNGVNWFFEFAAFQLFLNGVMPGLGEITLGALMVVMVINGVSFMPAFGVASAGAVLAGEAIGRGDRDAVWPQVRLTLGTTLAWMGGVGLLYLVAPHVLLGWFAPPDHRAELIAVGATMLMMSAGWQLFDATAMTFTEVLRAAGDTTWSAAARIVLAWGVFTPTAFVAVRVLHGGAITAMACLVLYLGLLAGALAWRFRTGAWRRIELTEPELA